MHSPTHRRPVARRAPPRCVQGSTTRTAVRVVSHDHSTQHLDRCRVLRLVRLTRRTVARLVREPLRWIALHSRQSSSLGMDGALRRTLQSFALTTCIANAGRSERGHPSRALPGAARRLKLRSFVGVQSLGAARLDIAKKR